MVEEIARLERVKSAAAAGQARLTAVLADKRRAAEAAAGVPRAKQCRGLASEVALARRDSPVRGGRHLGFATALVFEMPHTLAALECGALSEWRATLIVRESACLDVEDRRTLDAEMCADVTKLDGLGDARITADAKAIAYRLDPQAVVDRAAKAESERTVTIRPAPDAMAYVSILLPVAKGVGVYAALKRAADTTFDDRSRGQVMADTAYERVTGTPADVADPVAVDLVITDETLLGGDDVPARSERLRPHSRLGGARAGAARRSATSGRGARCGGSTATRSRVRWWRWSRDRGSFPKGWRCSSGCATKPAAPRIATRRSATAITLSPDTAMGRQAPTTGSANANAATTPRNHRAGGLPRAATRTVYTQPNSRRPPDTATDRPHHRYRDYPISK